jgi:VanZ family protein
MLPCLSDTMPSVRRLASTWLPPLVWMAIIFAFSAQHGSDHYSTAMVVLRKLAHVTEYLILTLLLFRALMRSGAASPLPIAALAALAYASSDEWHQSFVPGRTSTPRDVAIDGIGIALASVAAARIGLRARTS